MDKDLCVFGSQICTYVPIYLILIFGLCHISGDYSPNYRRGYQYNLCRICTPKRSLLECRHSSVLSYQLDQCRRLTSSQNTNGLNAIPSHEVLNHNISEKDPQNTKFFLINLFQLNCPLYLSQ